MKKPHKPEAPPAPSVVVDVGEVPLRLVEPNPENPRGKVRPEDVRELADSIRTHGVLNPLLVRELPGKPLRYQVLAGDRRRAAAQLAGLDAVPCRAYVSDRELAPQAATIVENDQRESLGHFAEARAVLALVRAGSSHAAAAKLLGRSEPWVRRRAGLCTLSKKVLDADFVEAREWPIEWLEDLASVAPEVQERLAGRELVGVRSRQHLQEVLFGATAELGQAPWRLDDAALVRKAGDCHSCPKRSAVAPGLFDLVERKNGSDRCLDVPCYRQKLKAHRARILADARKGHGGRLLAAHGLKRHSEAGVRMPGPALEPDRYERVARTVKGARAAVLVDGKHAGRVVHVRVLEAPKMRRAGPERPELAAKKLREGQVLSHAVDEVRRIFSGLSCPGGDATVVLAVAYGPEVDRFVDKVLGRGDTREARLALAPTVALQQLWKKTRESVERTIAGDVPWIPGTVQWFDSLRERAQEAEVLARFFDARAPKGAPPFDWKAILGHAERAVEQATPAEPAGGKKHGEG